MLSVTENRQPVTGVTPPQLKEAIIRMAWPSVAAMPLIATLGRKAILSFVFAPLGWFLMLPFYFLKVLPFVAKRYTLTNRRLMIQRGLKPKASEEVPLAEIDEVIIHRDANSIFFRAGDLDIVHKGKVRMKLRGVPEPDAFRHTILNSCMAWVPDAAKKWVQFIPAKAPDGK
jgi:hypothetical protein